MAPASSSNPLLVLWELRAATGATATAKRTTQEEEQTYLSQHSQV